MMRNGGPALRGIWDGLAGVFAPARTRTGKRRASGRPRELHLEHLDERCLLAGLVTVTTNTSGDVTIRGDSANNYIALFPSFPDLRIQGYSDTLISYNGSISSSHYLFPYVVVRDLRIDMQGGHDNLIVDGVEIGRDLIINMAAGEDRVRMFGTFVGRDTTVNLGADRDQLDMDYGNSIGRNLRVDGGTGNFEDNVDIYLSSIGGNVLVNLGASSTVLPDELIMNEVRIQGDLTVQQAANRAHVEMWDYTVHGNTRITTGAGADFVWLGYEFTETRHIGTFTLDTGADDDTVLLEEFWVGGRATVTAGAGNDSLRLKALTVGASEFRVDLGAGNDRLEFVRGVAFPDYQIFFGSFIANGGSGTDTLVRPGLPTYYVEPVFTSFENTITLDPPAVRANANVNDRIFRDYEELTGHRAWGDDRISEIFRVA